MSERLMLVIKLGAEMRVAQTRYFETRAQRDLTTAKTLERRFDEALASVLAAPIDPFTFNRGSRPQ